MNIHLYVECAYTFFCVCIQTHLLNSLLFPVNCVFVCVICVFVCDSLSLALSSSLLLTRTRRRHTNNFSARHVRTHLHRHTETLTHALSRNTCHVAPPPLRCNTHTRTHTVFVCEPAHKDVYGVTTISRLLKIIGLFCKRAL